MVTLKRDFASGLIVLVPLIVTLFVLMWLYTFIAGTPFLQYIGGEQFIPLPDQVAEFVRVMLTLAIFALLVLGVGYMMRTAFGRLIESAIDRVINRVPGVRVVYNASKMAAETALTGTESLQKPIKLEPWKNMRVTAFKTGKRTSDGKEIVFMPTAPNITSGFVLEVREEDYEETDESVEEALTRLLSAGFGEDTGVQRTIGEQPFSSRDDRDQPPDSSD